MTMSINDEAKVTAEAIGLIMRQQALTSDYSFSEIWSETASGYSTYGGFSLVWTSFVRNHNSNYWHNRVLRAVRKRRKEGTL